MPGRPAEALAAQRRATLTMLRGLHAEDWERSCLPPWRVRDVVAHLIAVDEAVVTGRFWPVLRTYSRTELERWNDVAILRLAAASPDELLDGLERWGRRLERVVARIPRLLARVRLRTARGRQPVRVLVCRRVLDEWVHAIDIGRATGARPELAEGVADALATAVLDTLPRDVLPRLSDRAGVLRLVVATGTEGDPHGPRRTWGIDCARRHYGPRVAARPDATVRLHASTLALLAEGRVAWSDPELDVVVEGDAAFAARLFERLGAEE